VSTEVAVVVPWRAGDPDREAAWEWLRPRWADLGPVLEGVAPAGPWCKAAAVADGLAGCDAEIVVIADADVWCDDVDQAVGAVAGGAPWAVPHLNVYRLDAASTAAVLAGGPLGALAGHRLAEKPYRGHVGGGIVVLRRSTYLDCPIDPRFVGWGQEDDAWALALTALHGRPARGRFPLWHLWHEPQDRMTRRTGSPDNRDLFLRYRSASHNPDSMRRLVEEAKCASFVPRVVSGMGVA
jgi:hypothetical protein